MVTRRQFVWTGLGATAGLWLPRWARAQSPAAPSLLRVDDCGCVMARSFNGTSDSLDSASALTMSSATKLTVAWWMRVNGAWDTGNNGRALANTQEAGGQNGVVIVPAHTDGFLTFMSTGSSLYAGRYFTRPSVDAWHHYVITLDRAVAGAGAIVAAWVDGASQSVTDKYTDTLTGGFTDETLHVGWGGSSFYMQAALQAEVALWLGLNFSQTDVDNLYNSGNGTAATNVQNGSLAHYWKICGTASPEPATTGGVNLTVTGTSGATHPISTCAAGRTTKNTRAWPLGTEIGMNWRVEV